MSANLGVYFLAEQAKRERLSSDAASGWLAEQAAAVCVTVDGVSKLRQKAGAVLIRAGTRLRGAPSPGATSTRLGPVGGEVVAP